MEAPAADDEPYDPDALAPDHKLDLALAFRAVLSDTLPLAATALDGAVVAADAQKTKAFAKRSRALKNSFKQWLLDSLAEKGAGKAHKLVKGKEAAFDAAQGVVLAGKAAATPMQKVIGRSGPWVQQWEVPSPQPESEQTRALMCALRRRAAAAGISAFASGAVVGNTRVVTDDDARSFLKAAREYGDKKALGGDFWMASELAGLPLQIAKAFLKELCC